MPEDPQVSRLRTDEDRIWHRLAMVGRSVSQKITKHNHKMGGITVRDLCSTVQGIWAEIVSFGGHSVQNSIATEFLEAKENYF